MVDLHVLKFLLCTGLFIPWLTYMHLSFNYVRVYLSHG